MGPLQLSDRVVQNRPNWRANDALGHVIQRKFKFGGWCPSASFARHLLLVINIYNKYLPNQWIAIFARFDWVA